jgi:hypothetical protein
MRSRALHRCTLRIIGGMETQKNRETIDVASLLVFTGSGWLAHLSHFFPFFFENIRCTFHIVSYVEILSLLNEIKKIKNIKRY